MHSPSKIFDFYKDKPERKLERHEIFCAPFLDLRKCIFRMTMKLYESGDKDLNLIASRVRALLSTWLTVPVQFDRELQDSLTTILGTEELVRIRMGGDIAELYREAKFHLAKLCEIENPLASLLRIKINELMASGKIFKIYCHPRSASYFHSFFREIDLSDLCITSLGEYRSSEIFDVLVKIGPMRSRGWGAVPDAIVTAPKFDAIAQYVWAGSSDEDDFGFDPVCGLSGSSSQADQKKDNLVFSNSSVKWKYSFIQEGNALMPALDEGAHPDELEYFSLRNNNNRNRKCTFISLCDNRGVFYHSHGRVLGIEPASSPIAKFYSPCDGLKVGMFIVLANIQELDFGASLYFVGNLTERWKKKLAGRFNEDYGHLVAALRAEGVGLRNIESAICSWFSIGGSVIHAPQTVENFRRLLKVLQFDDELVKNSSGVVVQFWQASWDEILRSRSKAIQEGQVESELLGDEILSILEDQPEYLVQNCAHSDEFVYQIPEKYGINGELRISRALQIEDGYFPPSSEIKKIIQSAEADQWQN